MLLVFDEGFECVRALARRRSNQRLYAMVDFQIRHSLLSNLRIASAQYAVCGSIPRFDLLHSSVFHGINQYFPENTVPVNS